MSVLMIVAIVSLFLVPIIRAANRAATPPAPPQGWQELSWEEELAEAEQEPARLGYQSIEMPVEEEGQRSIEVVEDPMKQPSESVARPPFDLRGAVVAETILNAKYKDE